jgi:hypothetical protein
MSCMRSTVRRLQLVTRDISSNVEPSAVLARARASSRIFLGFIVPHKCATSDLDIAHSNVHGSSQLQQNIDTEAKKLQKSR